MAAIPAINVNVYQQFGISPPATATPRRALIVGPEYALHRPVAGVLDPAGVSYDSVSGNTLDFADMAGSVGGTPDPAYTSLFAQLAELEYYPGAAQSTGLTGYIPAATRNILTIQRTAANVNLASADYALDVALHGRPVQVGDRVQVSYGGATEDYRITGLRAETAAPVIAAPAENAGNTADTVAANPTTATLTAGTTSAVLTTSGGAYDGIAAGHVTETYYIECIRATTGCDPTTALFKVTSASGTDNVAMVSLTAANTDVDLGTRGCKFKITTANSHAIPVGARWSLAVATLYSKPTVTDNSSPGTAYTGPEDTTYVVECIQGTASIAAGTPAVMRITTTNGVDYGTPVTMSAASTPYAIGNYGVTLTIAWGGGDVLSVATGQMWTIACTAAAPGKICNLVLDRTPCTAIRAASTSGNITSISLRKYSQLVEIPAELVGAGYLENWTTSSTALTVNPGAGVFSADWRSGQYPLLLVAGTLAPSWRELVLTHAFESTVVGLDTFGSVFTTPNDPDNPLVYGAYKALLNSNGNAIRVMGVPTDDLAGFTASLGISESNTDCYPASVMTQDTDVLDLLKAHVDLTSSPAQGNWREAFVSVDIPNPLHLLCGLSTGQDSTLTATLTASGAGVEIQLSAGALAAGASFTGVQAGDQLRVGFGVDSYGNPTYTTLTVSSVTTLDTLYTVDAPSVYTDVAQMIAVYRPLTGESLAVNGGQLCGAFGDRRVTSVFPNRLPSAGIQVAGYYLAAAIAGLRSGVAPHQGLSRMPIVGFDNAGISSSLSTDQLDTLTSAGVSVLVQDHNTGVLYLRHAVTTDVSNLNFQEEMMVSNVDSVSLGYRNVLEPYLGRANASPQVLNIIQATIENMTSIFLSSNSTSTLGPQIISCELKTLQINPTFRDRVQIVLNCVFPFAINGIDLYITA